MSAPAKPSILLVGVDANLLSTRAALLSVLGVEVECVTRTSEAIRNLERGNIGLIILCYSIAAKDLIAISNTAEQSPSPPAVLLINRFAGFNELSVPIRFDGFTDSDPASLIQSARALLFRKTAESDSLPIKPDCLRRPA